MDRRRGLGLALIAAATLTAEVALTRLLSAGLFHHFAFVVVSTAMFGTAAGGLAVVLFERLRERNADATAALACLGFAVGLPALFALSQQVPLEPLALTTSLGQGVWLAVVYLALATPFAVSGVAIAVLLDRFAEAAPKLYAADLAGASAGCFVALAALYAGPSGLYGAAVLALAAAVALKAPRLSTAIVGVGLAVAIGLSPWAPLPLRISASKVTRGGVPFSDVLANPAHTRATRWGPLGRVDLVDFARGGRRVILDAGVAAVRVPPEGARFRTSDVTLPYELRPGARVLIIGAGAGWEVAEALSFGAAHVDAVEINPMVAAFAPEGLKRHPKVRWHINDGRAFLHQSQGTYDAIILIHTISNAATTAGAMRLAEDYLLTVEALAAMRARLADDGLWLMTRPESQMPALIRNLTERAAGADQIVAWTEPPGRGGFYAAVMTRGAPWPADELAQLRARLTERQLPLLYDPASLAPRTNPLTARVTDALDKADDGPRPATDDRPYFHQHRMRFDIRELSGQQTRSRLALEDAPLAEASVIALLAQTTVMAAIVLLVPLVFDPRRRRLDTARLAIDFGGLGLGFMLVEVALVQRLGLLLGSPTLSFAVVFAGLLAGTAAGSRLSGRWPWPRHAAAAAAAAALLVVMLVPPVVRLGLPLPALVRIVIAFGTVALTGLALGLPFPLGLRAIGGRKGAVAWALAFNGVASVAGTSLAILIGAQLGLTATSLAAVVAYISAWAVRRAPSASR